MSELLEPKVRISIDRETYDAPHSISGAALYEMAEIEGHEEIFREVNGEHDDELINREAAEVRLTNGEHFYSQKAIDIVVNAEPEHVVKRRLSFLDVVKLAYPTPPPGANLIYTITYHRGPNHHPKGTLVAGQTVKIKEGMIFNVTATDKS